MGDSVSTNNSQLRWQGVRFASISVVIGCILFALIYTFPLLIDERSTRIFAVTIIIAVFASLFSLPFSIVSGYILGWIVQQMQYHTHKRAQSIVSGVAIACITLLIIFVLGGVIQTCLTSRGKCKEGIFAHMKQVILQEFEHDFLTKVGRIFVLQFLLGLVIAAVGGGITGWQLSRIE